MAQVAQTLEVRDLQQSRTDLTVLSLPAIKNI